MCLTGHILLFYNSNKIFKIKYQIYIPGLSSEEKHTMKIVLSTEIKAWSRKMLSGIV